MKRSTILCSLLPVLLVLFLCACSASPSAEDEEVLCLQALELYRTALKLPTTSSTNSLSPP